MLMDGLIGEEDVGIGLAELRRQIAVQRRTGLKVSRICLGTMACGVQVDETQSRAILDHAAEAGVSFIDTADGYPLFGNTATVGMTEEILGRWLAGKRQNFIVATKCCATMGPNPWDRGTSRRHILDAVDSSLRRLQTDWIDLYQLHNFDPEVRYDETLEALDSLVRNGNMRYIGCSNWPAFRIARAIGISKARNWSRFDSAQPRYSLLFRPMGARRAAAVPGRRHRRCPPPHLAPDRRVVVVDRLESSWCRSVSSMR